MAKRQNVLSTIMLRNVKLCNENVRLQQKYARPETYLANLVFIFDHYKYGNNKCEFLLKKVIETCLGKIAGISTKSASFNKRPLTIMHLMLS